MPKISAGAAPSPPKLSRMALLAIACLPLPLLAGWSLYARSAGLAPDAMRIPMIVSIVWGVIFVFLSWRRLDEGGREAIKFAFCWGAGPGMMLAAGSLLLVLYFPQPLGDAVEKGVNSYISARESEPGAWRPEVMGFFLGGAFVIGIQQMLFVLVWLGWWIRRRMPRP
jgi:hypothetical protein